MRPKKKASKPRSKPPKTETSPRAEGRRRLQRILADAGFASRRGAEQFLRDGRVTVNGVVASLGDSADLKVDKVAFDGERIRVEALAYWRLNKPRGVLTTMHDPHGRRTVANLLPRTAAGVVPVGRLDLDSEGLLLLTNDGRLSQALLHPSYGSEREYQVSVRGELTEKARRSLERGVHLEEGRTAPAKVSKVRVNSKEGTSQLHLTLVEGKKRQIRRSMLVLGFPVRRLVRVRMGPITLGRMAPGEARPLSAEEVRALHKHADSLEAARPASARGRVATRKRRS